MSKRTYEELETDLRETTERMNAIEVESIARINQLMQEVEEITRKRLTDVRQSGLFKQLESENEQNKARIQEWCKVSRERGEENLILVFNLDSEIEALKRDRNDLTRINARLVTEIEQSGDDY